MGRVYNALAKADRLTDRQRPIGRPDSEDRVTRQQRDAAMGSTPQPVRRDSTTTPAFGFGDESHTAPSESTSDALSSDFDYLFALSETTGARRAAEPALLSTEESVAVSPRPRVPASSFRVTASPRACTRQSFLVSRLQWKSADCSLAHVLPVRWNSPSSVRTGRALCRG